MSEVNEMKFIYVFNTKDRDKLQNTGFILLKEDERNSVYVFATDDSLNFALDDMSYLRSDILTF